MVKAIADPRAPEIATSTAMKRCPLVTWEYSECALDSAASSVPSAGTLDPMLKKVVGRAMSVTPMKEMRAPTCSSRVKGSRSSIAHAKQDNEGAMKVTTVASASGMYNRESRMKM